MTTSASWSQSSNPAKFYGVVQAADDKHFRATYWVRVDHQSHVEEGEHEHEMCASEGEAWTLIEGQARARGFSTVVRIRTGIH
jgi:hypothetical protein